MRTKPAGSAWKSVANSASPSEVSATARLARSNSRSTAMLLAVSASRCRSSATSSGPGCGKLAIGAASDGGGGWNGVSPRDGNSQV